MTNPTTHTQPCLATDWQPWPDIAVDARAEEETQLERFRLAAFRVVLLIAAAALIAISLRGLAMGGRPWADMANAAFMLVVQWAAARWPRRLRVLAWAVLVSLFINVADGLFPLRETAVSGTHVLLPLLVLYGALLGDLLMSIVALVVVLGLNTATAVIFDPLPRGDVVKLVNLSIAAVVTGFAALSVWLQHRRLEEALYRQAENLRRELGVRLQLSSVISHDIRNPLGALLAVVDLAKVRGEVRMDDLEAITAMGVRISDIINSVRDIEQRSDASTHTTVSVEAVVDELRRVLDHRLQEKEQTLVLTRGGELAVRTNARVLCNSVLSNILTNAIKFSPRQAQLEIAAERDGERIRFELCDHGPGFPQDIIAHAVEHARCQSTPGTEGEMGTGAGLHIAALYARMLEGDLEIRNRAEGGAAVAVVVPAASHISPSRTRHPPGR